jgi:TrmH family RNA methyltransferase
MLEGQNGKNGIGWDGYNSKMKYIQSSDNSLIKEVKSLKVKKYRQAKKLFSIEGLRIIEDALKSDFKVKYLFISDRVLPFDIATKSDVSLNSVLNSVKNSRITDILSVCISKNCGIYIIQDKIFKEISDTKTPQGILAVIRMNEYSLQDILKNSLISGNSKGKADKNRIIILDGIKDPGNMGTIIRTANGAGFGGIIVSKECVDIYNPKVLRATMGSIFYIPQFLCTNFADTLYKIKDYNIKIYASHLEKGDNYFDVDMTGDIALIIGSEAHGISKEASLIADSFVKIPMSKGTESLNASVAAGILMYEPLRQTMSHK